MLYNGNNHKKSYFNEYYTSEAQLCQQVLKYSIKME